MELSIIVLSHNNLTATHKCISSLIKILRDGQELIVLDDYSNDGSREYVLQLNELGSNIKGIVFDEKTGLCAGRNAGLKLAKGNTILFLDNDTYSDTDFITVLEQKMKILQADVIGMCAVDTFDFKTYLHIHQHDLAGSMEVMSVTGYCLMIKREVVDKIGNFDIVYDIMDEDIDICLRAIQAGYRIFVVDSIPLVHSEHGSGFATSDKFRTRMLRNHKILEEKFLPSFRSFNLARFKSALVDNMTKSRHNLSLTNSIGDYHFYDSSKDTLEGVEK